MVEHNNDTATPMAYKAPDLNALLAATSTLPLILAGTTKKFISTLHGMGIDEAKPPDHSREANSRMLDAVYYAFCHHVVPTGQHGNSEDASIGTFTKRFDEFSRQLEQPLFERIRLEYSKLAGALGEAHTALKQYIDSLGSNERHDAEVGATPDMRLRRMDGRYSRPHRDRAKRLSNSFEMLHQFVCRSSAADGLTALFGTQKGSAQGRSRLATSKEFADFCADTNGGLKTSTFQAYFDVVDRLETLSQIKAIRKSMAASLAVELQDIARILALCEQLNEQLAIAAIDKPSLHVLAPETPLADEFVAFLAGLCKGAMALNPIDEERARQFANVVRHADHKIDVPPPYAEDEFWAPSVHAAREFWSTQSADASAVPWATINEKMGRTWHVVPFIALAAIAGSDVVPSGGSNDSWLKMAWEEHEVDTKARGSTKHQAANTCDARAPWLTGLCPSKPPAPRATDAYANFAKLKETARDRGKGKSERPIVEAERSVRVQTHNLLDRAYAQCAAWVRVALLSKRLAFTANDADDVKRVPEEWVVDGRNSKRFTKAPSELQSEWCQDMQSRWTAALKRFYPAACAPAASVAASGNAFIADAAKELAAPPPNFRFNEPRTLLEDCHFTRLYGERYAKLFEKCIEPAGSDAEIASDAQCFARFLLLTPYRFQTIKAGRNGAWFSQLPGEGDFVQLVRGVLRDYGNLNEQMTENGKAP